MMFRVFTTGGQQVSANPSVQLNIQRVVFVHMSPEVEWVYLNRKPTALNKHAAPLTKHS